MKCVDHKGNKQITGIGLGIFPGSSGLAGGCIDSSDVHALVYETSIFHSVFSLQG
jgi:hypothetical protein